MIVPTKRHHIGYVANNMRREDVAEIWASSHEHPNQALWNGLRVCSYCYTILTPDGYPMAIYGVAPMSNDVGVPWLLGTNQIKRNQKYFLSITHSCIEDMLRYRPQLANYVHAENETSKRWLRYGAFNLEDAEPHGREQELFHLFWRAA